MKDYDLTPQERNNFCACSVLQSIFRYHDINIAQTQIASELNPSEKGFYLDDKRMNEFMNKNGFSYEMFRYNTIPFGEPDFLFEDMKVNHGFIGMNSHIFLLKDFRDPELELIDPLKGKSLTKNMYLLLNEIRNPKDILGLIKYIV